MGNTNDTKYIGTFQGKFTLRANENTPGAVSRINKLDKQVWEVQFNQLKGILKDIEIKDGDYGERYQFVIQADDGEKASLECALNSNLASTIINRLPNLDLTQPFEIVARWNASKERAMFFLNQDNEKVEDFFQSWDADSKTWTMNHKFPAWEKKEINGKETWDASAQIKYQKQVVAKYLAEMAGVAAEATPEPAPVEKAAEEEEDDLPF